MIRLASAPLHDWQRREPTARAIAAAIDPVMLALRSRLIAADIRARFGVCESVAYRAIGLARRGGA